MAFNSSTNYESDTRAYGYPKDTLDYPQAWKPITVNELGEDIVEEPKEPKEQFTRGQAKPDNQTFIYDYLFELGLNDRK